MAGASTAVELGVESFLRMPIRSGSLHLRPRRIADSASPALPAPTRLGLVARSMFVETVMSGIAAPRSIDHVEGPAHLLRGGELRDIGGRPAVDVGPMSAPRLRACFTATGHGCIRGGRRCDPGRARPDLIRSPSRTQPPRAQLDTLARDGCRVGVGVDALGPWLSPRPSPSRA
jgi:hypothetical protein